VLYAMLERFFQQETMGWGIIGVDVEDRGLVSC
jgi:hypothetical protein